jgi:hypothetical protein
VLPAVGDLNADDGLPHTRRRDSTETDVPSTTNSTVRGCQTGDWR